MKNSEMETKAIRIMFYIVTIIIIGWMIVYTGFAKWFFENVYLNHGASILYP